MAMQQTLTTTATLGSVISDPSMTFEDKIGFLRSVDKVDKEFTSERIQQGTILCKQILKPDMPGVSLLDFQTSCIVDAHVASTGKDSFAITNVDARAPILGNFNHEASCFIKPVELPDGTKIYKDNTIRLPPDETMYPLDPKAGYSCSCKTKPAKLPGAFNIVCADNTKEDVLRSMSQSPKRRRF